jgi:hypothetical protein
MGPVFYGDDHTLGKKVGQLNDLKAPSGELLAYSLALGCLPKPLLVESEVNRGGTVYFPHVVLRF